MNRRALAAETLRRVRTGGAYANVLLDHLDLPEEARGGLRASVLGSLRWIGEIEVALQAALDRPLGRLQPEVHHLLLVGAHELLHTGNPPAVVVSDCVDAVRQLGAPKAAGLVNAVLRRVAANGPPELDPVSASGFPRWAYERLEAAWGAGPSLAFVEASNRPPRVGIRVPPGREVIGDPVPGIPEARLLDRPAPGYPVQDPASVAVVQALDPHPGDRVVDIGAAPGGKTRHLLDRVGPDGVVVALERHPRRARTGRGRAPEAGWVVGDGVSPPLRHRAFDRVLLDAPCSGLGTLRRRPEVRERVTEGEVDRLAALQRRLLESALDLLAPDGTLVYAVCTVLPEETVEVVAGLGFRAPDLPGARVGAGILLGPPRGPTDGMFVAVTGGA